MTSTGPNLSAPGPGRRPGTPWQWGWGAVLASVAVCAAIFWMHFEQIRLLEGAVRARESLRQARIEMAKGFLHASLGAQEGSPFNRAAGLALLDQAVATLEQAHRWDEAFSAEPGVPGTAASVLPEFQQSARAFRQSLADWRAGPVDAPELETRLRLAYYELEQQVGRVDKRLWKALEERATRYETVFVAAVGGASLLLLGLCGAVWKASRSQAQVEEALRESLSRISTLVDAAPFGAHSYELAPDGRLRFQGANRAADSILGFSHAPLRGKPIEEIFPGLAGTSIPAEYARVAAEGRPLQTEQIGYDHGQIRGAYEIHAFQTGPGRMSVFFRDITERKKAEAALKESEQKFRTVVENAGAIIFIINTEGKFLFSAGQGLAKLGLKPGQVVGLSALELYRGYPDVVASITKALQGQLTRAVHRLSGGVFDTVYSPHLDAEGRQTGLLGIAIDVTEQVDAQDALRQSNERIHALNAELEQRVAERTRELEAFAYSVSHDLRAPLRGIDGYTRMLLEDYAGAFDDNGRRVCGVIRDSARRMGQLIDDLLAFSRLGRAALAASAVDMEALARASFDEAAEGAGDGIELRAGPLAPAVGDPKMLRQVWANLLSNAVKFSSKTPRPVIEIVSEPGGQETVYHVRDNGAGFQMEYVSKLFGVFQRLHTEGEFPGTGVGLAIVHRVITRHGGRVWAYGQPGQGATFSFSLPNPPHHP